MNAHHLSLEKWNPGRVFYFGLALVFLTMWLPFIPAWPTFVHMWRVDLAASIFLFATLAYLAYRWSSVHLVVSMSREEKWLIVAPIVTFIAWSGLSVLWAPSWKSAVHHTVVWAEYLIVYFLFRHLVDHERHFGKLLKLFTGVLILFAIPAIVEYLALTVFGGETFFRARYAKYGEQIVTILPLLIVAVVRLSGKDLKLGLTAVVLLWLLIYCTAGRTNIALFALAIAAMAAVIFAVARFHRYRRKFALCVGLLVAAPVPFYLFSLAVSAPDVPILSRFSDTTGTTYSKDFRLLMNSVSLEMFKADPLKGVGADNYGMQFNAFRERYAAAHPGDPTLSYGEVGIVGHAHNEFLQVAAELGSVGVAILMWFLAGIALMAFRAVRQIRSNSLFPAAAVAGLALFLLSSAASAYSFRLMQNGLVFFFVLAVAAKALSKTNAKRPVAEIVISSPGRMRWAFAAGMTACILLAAYSTVRVSSVILTTRANYTHDLTEASELYQLAMNLDDENPDARSNFGMRLFQVDRFAEAAPLLADAIRIGRAQSVDFSYLASAQSLAGDDPAAEQTFGAAARLYPKSAFVLTRYATLLHVNGKVAESASCFEKALAIDRPAANTWWTMIRSGSQVATNLALKDQDYKPIMDLQPQGSMYAVLDERHVRFPHERLIFRRR